MSDDIKAYDFRADIIYFLNQIPVKYSTIRVDGRNVYLYGVSVQNTDDLMIACSVANRRHKILNIVEPDRDLTYICLSCHFTPFIENQRIVWSYW
jgi:hypothetical protein